MFVAEMVESRLASGSILFAEQNLRFEMMYVAIVSIGIIGFSADFLLRQIGKRLLVGQLTATEIRR